MKYILVLVACYAAAFTVIYISDQLTLSECATEHRVKLFGDTLTCSVVQGE